MFYRKSTDRLKADYILLESNWSGIAKRGFKLKQESAAGNIIMVQDEQALKTGSLRSCMEEKGAASTCPHCGYTTDAGPDSLLHLPPNLKRLQADSLDLLQIHGLHSEKEPLCEGNFDLMWNFNIIEAFNLKKYRFLA